jgi:pimeloyl-ACP methyl ester carboxylesterase
MVALSVIAPVPALLEEPVNRETWETVRRPALRETFAREVYGAIPPPVPGTIRFETVDPGTPMMEGRAIRKQVDVVFAGPGGEGRIHVLAFFPFGKAAVPATLFVCNREADENLDPTRQRRTPFWPVEEIVAQGFAAVAFFNGDVDPDEPDGFRNGVHGVMEPDPAKRDGSSWGTLSAWAWGASRVMDWIETEPRIHPGRVMLVGHSRGGKTALWAGANDPRFAMVVSNNSGCGGAKLFRADLPESESIAKINRSFPHWFCGNFHAYDGREAELPVDQHMLIALLAPRLVYVTSASEDKNAGPEGEFTSCVLASPAWELYGKRGLETGAFPPPNQPLQQGNLAYHLRSGEHDLKLYDWQQFLAFAAQKWNLAKGRGNGSER